MSHILGIDIGGTKLAVCLATEAGEILERLQFPTETERGPEAACRRLTEAAEELESRHGRAVAVGISAPGPLSSEEGRFLNPPNMNGWHDFPIARALSERLGRQVELMNDANAAAWAEWRWGAARDLSTMLFFTMSTGMGAGLVIGGRLHEGIDDLAGEIGHVRISADGPVGFGRRGSVEGYCSGPGIRQLTALKLHQAMHAQKSSELLDDEIDFRLLDLPRIGEAARNGDAVALDVFAEVGRRFGEFCSPMIDMLNPEMIVLGTIGRLFFDLIEPTARAEIDARCHERAARRVALAPAALGRSTGDLAAISAVLARR